MFFLLHFFDELLDGILLNFELSLEKDFARTALVSGGT
jgi:hypothetical protein